MRNFNEWLSGFRDSIADYGYYIDFKKVYRNVNSVKVELNILNSLIGSKNIEKDFENLISKYPEALNCIPLLLAVRANEIYCQDKNGGYLYKFDYDNIRNFKPNTRIFYENYKYFMRQTGLFDLLENHIINNLVDYVTGVETGLDSNGRKSRGGHLMEDLVEGYIQKAGFIKDINYFKEMKASVVAQKWGYDLSSILNNGKTEKRFDFVVKTENNVYVVETNFYATQGSKLNETARSYKQIAQGIANVPGVSFVWFTDGKGWQRSKDNLEETFDIMEHIYNIKDLENGIINTVFK